MWLRIGTFLGLSVWLVLATANDARAQDVLWVPRSQLFAAVLGQEIGQTLAHVMNAYALGKARKEELEALRSQVAKCGDNCSDVTHRSLSRKSRIAIGDIIRYRLVVVSFVTQAGSVICFT